MASLVWQKFNRVAAQYDQASLLQQQSAHYLLSVMGKVLPQSVWLDAGCGTGVLAKALAAQSARVWAIDLAPDMLKSLEDDDRIQTILADIRHLPLADDMLDGAVSNFALHWLGSGIVPEIMRVVQPGGTVWLAVPVQGSLSEVMERCPGFPLFEFEPAQAWLDQAGSAVQWSEVRRFSQNYPQLKALLAAIRQMGGDHTGLTTGQHTEQPASQNTSPRHQLSLWKQWLSDPSPIDLSFEVLFLQLKKPADDHGLAFLYE